MSDEHPNSLPPADMKPSYAAPLPDRHRLYFMLAGILFLAVSLILFVITALMLYTAAGSATLDIDHDQPIDRNKVKSAIYIYAVSVIGPSVVSFLSAVSCSFMGIRLLRSSGAVITQVIPPQDYPLLGPAIAAGDDRAISQYIRLSSLSGVTGTFTKIGLTGLPLATIGLTLLLGIAGLANDQFFDLAKLTLGAFLGSFVQRQADSSIASSRTSQDQSSRTSQAEADRSGQAS